MGEFTNENADFELLLSSLFKKWLTTFEGEGEYGFTCRIEKDNKRVAYATNLTPETVEKAVKANADLLLTHHDAWDFLYSMREECVKKLKKHEISHFFIHLPLDFVEFGTCTSLFE